MAGRKPDFTTEDLFGFATLYAQDTGRLVTSFQELADYVDRNGLAAKKLDPRQIAKNSEMRTLIEKNRVLVQKDRDAASVVEKDLDAGEILKSCISPDAVKKAVHLLCGTIKEARNRLAGLNAEIKRLKTELKSVREENAKLVKQLETAGLLTEQIEDIRQQNEFLSKRNDALQAVFEKYVLNETALKHFCDIHILGMSPEEKERMSGIPENWEGLLFSGLNISGAVQEKRVLDSPLDHNARKKLAANARTEGQKKTPPLSFEKSAERLKKLKGQTNEKDDPAGK